MRIEEWHSAAQGVPDGFDALVAAASSADGHRPIGEHALAELKAGPQEMPHAAFIARDGEDLLGYAHVSYRDTGAGWRLEFVTHPRHRGQGVATMLVRHVVDHVACDGGGDLHTWAPDDDSPARVRLVRRFGLAVVRRLHQQHGPLPVEVVPIPSEFSVRCFTDTDETEWLRLHNEVFAEHPDASNWRASDLGWRMREPWFDADGFRLAFDDYGLAGYNWVKMHTHEGAAHDVHDPHTRVVAEIYMLGVGARARGTSLAAAIATDGLRWGSDQGATRAMLYVDETNRSARRLYERLGFTTTHVDVCYALEVPPRSGSNDARKSPARD